MTLRKQIGSLITLVALSACAGTVTDVNQLELSDSTELAVIASNPYIDFNAAQRKTPTEVPIDQPIEILFNQQIDAASTLLPNNFELWTADGSPVEGIHDIGTRLVKNPLNPSQLVSLVRFRTESGFLPSNETLTFMWRDTSSSRPGANESTSNVGIYSVNGSALKGGGFTFRTGTKSKNNFERSNLEILSITPGRMFNKTAVLTKDYRKNLDQYVTVNESAPIKIDFSEPIFNLYNAFDNTRQEIPSTDISEFPALTVGVIDDVSEPIKVLTNSVGDFWNNAKDFKIKLNTWDAYREKSIRTLKGTVRTENNRKTLIFQLYENARYPDSMSQAVVVIVTGLASANNRDRKLARPYHVGGFIHFSGYELGLGFPSIKNGVLGFIDWLGGKS